MTEDLLPVQQRTTSATGVPKLQLSPSFWRKLRHLEALMRNCNRENLLVINSNKNAFNKKKMVKKANIALGNNDDNDDDDISDDDEYMALERYQLIKLQLDR